MRTHVATPVGAPVDELGEGPRWDAAAGELLTVNIVTGVFRRSVWTGDRLQVVREHRLGSTVGAVNPVRDGGYIAACGSGLAWVDTEGRTAPVSAEASAVADAHPGDNRMNDAACDPHGRLWAGSMPLDTTRIGAGRLVRLDADLSLTTVLEHVTVSNGLVWNRAADLLWYADSADPIVWVFDHDPATGAVADRRAALRVDGGVPDGMTRDDDDHLWVAVHGAGEVRRYDPQGRVTDIVVVPGVAGVTSCAFGGPDRGTLFVTTAWIGMTAAERAVAPHAGRVHAVRPGPTGPPAAAFAGRRRSSASPPGTAAGPPARSGAPLR